MANRRVPGLTQANKFLLVSAGAFALAGPVAIGLVIGFGSTTVVRAQSPSPTVPAPVVSAAPEVQAAAALPEFDAASIKLIDRSAGGSRGTGPVWFEPGRAFTKNSVTPDRMILAAYHLQDFQLFGGPAWISSDWFALEAKAANSSADESQLRLMLQALMRDRFQLVVHRETREMPVYALVVGKHGTKLQEWKDGDPVPPRDKGEHSVSASGPGTVERFVNELNIFKAMYNIDLSVVDKTGLKGVYLFNWWWDSDDDFRAEVIEDELGLKLEAQKAPVDVLVVDHIARPSEN